jgi:hypothetical protein
MPQSTSDMLEAVLARRTQLWLMAANAAATEELERAKENGEGSPIPTP